jgi:tetratricopeptide (TPR) repeat protein
MPEVAAAAGAGFRPRLGHALAVAAVAAAVYANALPNAFLWDDLHLVVANPAIKRWDAVPALFTSDLFPGPVESGYYRPLQALSYALDYALWGLAPAGFRLTNVALHAATAVLLHRVAGALFASAAAALVAALLFAVHPLHVEAVAYVAGRSDPLAAACLLLAVLGFVRGDRRGRVVSVAAFALALLAREAALVLPLLLVVVDRVPPRAQPRPLRTYLPYLFVLAGHLALRAVVVGGAAAPAPTAAVPLHLRLLTTAEVVVRYLGLVVAPVGLHMERHVAPVASGLDPRALAAVGALVALAWTAVACRRRAWPVTLGLAWFAVALLPVANVVPLATFMAEHWLYVPLMGLCLAAGWGATALPAPGGRPLAAIAAAAAIAVFAGLTVRRNLEWRDGRTLYAALLPLAPESLRVRVNLAEAQHAAGDLDGARRLYEEVVRRWPERPETADALNNLGNLDHAAGRPAAALAAFDAALALRPRHVAARNGRALALQALGRVDEAERELEAALAIDPASATTLSNLGNLYFRRNDVARARDRYLAAVRLDPDHADAHNNLGSAHFLLGERGLAERAYRRALALDPGSVDARRNLALVLGAPPSP